MNTPLLIGQRVRLAAPNPETDLDIWAAWGRNSEFLRLLDADPAQPWSLHQTRKELDELPEPNQVPLVIRTLAEDRVVGFVGLFGIQWTHGDAWVGIGIGAEADWGQGYGTDAMQVMVRYAFAELNLHRVTLLVFEYNPRAIRSYEKAGFEVEGRLRQTLHRNGRRYDELLMGLLRSDWERRHG